MSACRILTVFNEVDQVRYAILECPTCRASLTVPVYSAEHQCPECSDELELDWGSGEGRDG